jgi:bifunctional UDP-N-acetylglucosamine pyrophosphorylase/glucosamine-1-phosphate N-acetyltransferase
MSDQPTSGGASPLLVIILAAGQGTRMNSALPKVLHPLAGAPMLAHVMSTAAEAGAHHMVVVVGNGAEQVAQFAQSVRPDVKIAHQTEQLGTAHAVAAARPAFDGFAGDVVVLYADTPLVRSHTISEMRACLRAGAGLVVLGFEAADPAGYGRLIRDADGLVVDIREDRDATAQERAITLCNSGVMAFRSELLPGLLERVGNANAKGEYYLTDTVALARSKPARTGLVVCPEAEVLGVNDRVQLAQAEALMQDRLRERAMRNGATLIAPHTVTLSHDTAIGRDVVIEPNVIFGPGVRIGDGVRINGFCHIEQAVIQDGAIVGPFARLRPGTQVGPKAKIGNFVEIKNARLDQGAKVNHLSYVGDALVGANSNIGAGTITCNYDGFSKHLTEIGPGAFIGSNTSLVAPVTIGEGAYIGSGSVITRNVAAGSLALSRTRQEQHNGWADRMRAKRERKKSGS